MFQAFLSLPEVRQTGTFFLFWGIAGLEPDTGSLAASLTKLGKTVCLPRVVPGFGMECRVYRPELPMAISGFGGGYYDRWLESFSGTTVGLCRECVLQRSLPVEPHDLGVHVLVTDRRVLRF